MIKLNHRNRFELSIKKDVYSSLNKNKKIVHLFRSSNVGKCAKLFDDYFQQTTEINAKDWFLYYKSIMGIEIIKEVSEKIKEITELDLDICYNYSKFRILCQTWNGMLNEIDVINELKSEFPNVEFKKAPYELDENYFTDWEAYSKGTLFLGIQIKPITYKLMSTPYQQHAKLNHDVQRKKYIEEFKVPHFLIYYDNGMLCESETTTNKINTLLINLIEVK